jgi:hypothetical protein
VTAPFCGWVLTLKVKAAPSGSVPVMVKVAGVSSFVVILKLFTVGACGAGSLLVGLEEQVQMNKMLKNKMIFLILHKTYKNYFRMCTQDILLPYSSHCIISI